MNCIGLNSSGLQLLRNLEDEDHRSFDSAVKIWDIWRFTNTDGLMADPSRFIQAEDEWGQAQNVSPQEFLSICVEQKILIEKNGNYFDSFKDKVSFLDKKNIGNFHQQLGQHLLLKKRQNPEEWWLNQKFDSHRTELKNNLYKAIQGSYLETYFAKTLSEEMRVLDVGCGTGFYSKMMSQHVSHILGVDPTQRFLDIAEKSCPHNVDFKNISIGTEGCFDSLPDSSFDCIFMSDALLFYFVPPDKTKIPKLDILLRDIKRLLKKDGLFINMEPHYIFWLTPWLGELDRPFTVLTEYLRKQFKVVPSLSEYVQSITRNGFCVSWMDELTPNESFKEIDRRAYYFAREFPLWQIFEFTHTNPWRTKK
tara:strand:+ start:6571 stop:7665 length:1095 start_codon:yes stop_codon:yes gene_type:complete